MTETPTPTIEKKRNLNDEMMVKLWLEYHFLDTQKYELLYYDRK